MQARRWFQFRLATIFVIVTIVACALAFGPWMRAYLNIRSLSNGDVKVDGSHVGLMVSVDSSAASALRQQGKSANPLLLAALRDPEKFAAAHVLLTDIKGPTWPMLSGGDWNGMRVSLFADGRVDFHPEQVSALAANWETRLKATRR